STSCTDPGQSQSSSCSITITPTPIPTCLSDSSYQTLSGGTWGSGGDCGTPPCTGNTLDQTLASVGLTPAAPDSGSDALPTGSCTPCYATDLLPNCQYLPIVPSSSCGSSPPLD